jgi:hypothetical protein
MTFAIIVTVCAGISLCSTKELDAPYYPTMAQCLRVATAIQESVAPSAAEKAKVIACYNKDYPSGMM